MPKFDISPQPSLDNAPGFVVVGLTTKTTNADETSTKNGRIGPLWRNFLSQGDHLIPGEPDRSAIFSVYTDYESDETGPYTVVLGRSVDNWSGEIPGGMKRVELESSQYLVFRAQDRNPESVREAWERVHQHFREQGEFKRKFTADFEEYGPNGVSLHIAVR